MDAVALAEVMGRAPGVDYPGLLPGYEAAMVAAGVTTPLRAAMFAAQVGHESAGLRYMRELASGAEYEGRSDLGNTQPGDGVRFAGRGPIQLTGRANYGAFTRWVNERGLSGEDFVARPELLEEPGFGFLAAAFYWVVARPDINSLADSGDLEGVTRRINGGLNGLEDRRLRYEKALSMGDRLVPGSSVEPVERVLEYPRDQVTQDTGYFCGPASVQTVVRAATGELVSEQTLAAELGTTTNGTDWIGQITGVLNARVPGVSYHTVEMSNDPPSVEQVERLWRDVVASVDAGVGVVANIVAPPSNYPRAVAPSTVSPAYSGGTIYHYVALMGYGADSADRRVWVADSGFDPYGYWISLDQLGSLIPPKGYSAIDGVGGLFSLLSEERQEDLAAKIDRIFHELTYEFQSRYKGVDGSQSEFRDTLAGFLLEIDRKVEDVHANMLPAVWESVKDKASKVRKKVWGSS